MTFLFWDIDGTLLTTGRAGIIAWEDACRAITQQTLDFQNLKTDGLTDHQVAMSIMAHARHQAADADLARMVQCYEDRLPARLYERKGRVLEGVREALEYFRDHRRDIHSMLLTGNTEAGARAKLAHYGLAGFFEGGAFSIDSGPRATIAARALQAIRAKFPDERIEPHRVFVIGDTPHDIDCAKAIDARAIAVATGVYSAADLRAHGAWRVFDRVPPPHQLTALIEDAGTVKN